MHFRLVRLRGDLAQLGLERRTSGIASRPETLPDSSTAMLFLIVASLSPRDEAAAAFIWAMTWFS